MFLKRGFLLLYPKNLFLQPLPTLVPHYSKEESHDPHCCHNPNSPCICRPCRSGAVTAAFYCYAATVTVTSTPSSDASDDPHHHHQSVIHRRRRLLPWLRLPVLCVSKHVREMRIPVCLFLLWCVPVYGFLDFWRPSSWLRLWRDRNDYQQKENGGLGLNTGEQVCLIIRGACWVYWNKQKECSYQI